MPSRGCARRVRVSRRGASTTCFPISNMRTLLYPNAPGGERYPGAVLVTPHFVDPGRCVQRGTGYPPYAQTMVLFVTTTDSSSLSERVLVRRVNSLAPSNTRMNCRQGKGSCALWRSSSSRGYGGCSWAWFPLFKPGYRNACVALATAPNMRAISVGYCPALVVISGTYKIAYRSPLAIFGHVRTRSARGCRRD